MKKAFTQIELVIMMAVISILSIFSYSTILETSNSIDRQNLERDKKLIIEKQKVYFLKYGKFITVTKEGVK